MKNSPHARVARFALSPSAAAPVFPRCCAASRNTSPHVARMGTRLRHPISDLAAVVTVTDDGGSSGRLRREYSVLPPGDIRNCMVALSQGRSTFSSRLFQYRFPAGRGLAGHSFGNLISHRAHQRHRRFPGGRAGLRAGAGHSRPDFSFHRSERHARSRTRRRQDRRRRNQYFALAANRIRRVRLVPRRVRPFPKCSRPSATPT